MNAFGPLLRALRKARGLTIKRVARELQVSTAYLHNVEDGTKHTSLPQFARLLDFYGYEPVVTARPKQT